MTQNEIEKLKVHIEDATASLARHKTALTTIPEDAKHISVRVMQQNLIDKLGEEVQRGKDCLAQLEEAAREKEKAKGLVQEKERKLGIVRYLSENPPRCKGCKRADKMLSGVDPFGRPIPGLEPIEFPQGGWTDPHPGWRLRYRCGHNDCPVERNGQFVYPDRARSFEDGGKDDGFPVVVPKKVRASKDE